jgi:hypothetical protein
MNDVDTLTGLDKAEESVKDAAITFMVMLSMCVYAFITLAQQGVSAVILGAILSVISGAFFRSLVTKSINLIKILLHSKTVTSAESSKTE